MTTSLHSSTWLVSTTVLYLVVHCSSSVHCCSGTRVQRSSGTSFTVVAQSETVRVAHCWSGTLLDTIWQSGTLVVVHCCSVLGLRVEILGLMFVCKEFSMHPREKLFISWFLFQCLQLEEALKILCNVIEKQSG